MASGTQNALKRLGYRYDTPTLDDLSVDRKPVVAKAFCTSHHCCPGQFHGQKVQKKVKRNASECPDCGHFLFWETEMEKK